MQPPRIITEPLGGSPLAAAGIAGRHPAWFGEAPGGEAGWAARVTAVGRSAASGWLGALGGAFGDAAPDRLLRTAAAGGVVVTTGQQPGLFGGPVYTLSKALSALALADEVERVTGVPTAPVFWAATDDADFAEATRVWLRTSDGAVEARHTQDATDGVPMADVPLGGVDEALALLAAACGSAPDLAVLDLVRRCYREGATIGDAYCRLMRGLLGPLGIAVLDASHPDARAAMRPHVGAALRGAPAVDEALQARCRELLDAGYVPQVPLVDGLSLVFQRVDGRKVRVPIAEAVDVAAGDGVVTPNVLLRPAVERRIMPTVAYVAGPGEFAYFAQVTAVATALGWDRPLAVPRWSATVLEPSVERRVEGHGVPWRDLAVAGHAEGVVARAATPVSVVQELTALRTAVAAAARRIREEAAATGAPLDARVVDGAERALAWRVGRLERRLFAGVKRREAGAMRDLAVARGALFPGGKRQERAHSFIPFLAVHGASVVTAMRAGAARHARALVAGTPLPHDA